MPAKKRRVAKKPVRKAGRVLKPKVPAATRPAVDPNHTAEAIIARISEKIPEYAETDMYRKQSWGMFANKVADAYAQETMLFCVTVNPDILANREVLESMFPCKICSPTEGLYTGGFNYITRGE